MSQTLYRKYRSQTFGEIVGQRATVRILRNSVAKERINHAYLFTGPRGTGKTSIARILAKAINCLEPADGDACGKCERCQAVAAGNAVDVIEIDAASNRGIADVKALRERVGYAPIELRYKVYIIDEVHMITREGFNALLKTLEEPPSHVVFMLCTTEVHKLPATILSRCVRFDFHRLPPDDLAVHLQKIAENEGFELDGDTAREIGALAEHSARDAISLLDQLMVYCEKSITTEAVRELFQLGDPELVPRVVDLAIGGDRQAVLGIWSDLVRQGADEGRFLLRCGAELKERYLVTGDERYMAAMEAAWQGVSLLKHESFPALLVELTMLRVSAALNKAAGRPAEVPAAAGSQAGGQVAAPSVQPVTKQEQVSDLVSQDQPVSAAERPWELKKKGHGSVKSGEQPKTPEKQTGTRTTDASRVGGGIWQQFLDDLQKHHLTTYSHLLHGVSARLDGSKLKITFNPDARQTWGFATRDVHVEAMLAAARRCAGPDTELEITLSGSSEAPVIAGQPAMTAAKAGPPPEVLHDIVEEPEPAGPPPSPADSGEFEQSVEFSWDAESEEPEVQRPTVQDAISLFDATELDIEE